MTKLRVAFIYFKVFLSENAAGDLCIFFQSRANKIDQNCMRKRNHIRREDEGEMQERKGNAMESAEKQGKKTTGKAEKAGKNWKNKPYDTIWYHMIPKNEKKERCLAR